MQVYDYNGEGDWSREAVLNSYARYCAGLGRDGLDLTPVQHVEGDRVWVYPVMERVIRGIEQGDEACKMIGIEFIEQDGSFPFGGTLKSNTARALRRAGLSDGEKERIRNRIVHMLRVGNVPREFREYAKLLRRVGLGGHRREIEDCADSSHWRVRRYVRYLLMHARENEAVNEPADG